MERSEPLFGHRREELGSVCEVTVWGLVANPGHARHFPERHCAWAMLLNLLQRRVDQRPSQIAVVVRSLPSDTRNRLQKFALRGR
jgi:hypothetical protein